MTLMRQGPKCDSGNQPDGCTKLELKVNYGTGLEEGFDRKANSLFGESGVQQRIIGHRDGWELPISVSKAGARLTWRFQTTSGNLAFGLRTSSGTSQVALERIETGSYVPQGGSWQCDTPGTYGLEFDNTHSWLSRKTLAYMVNLRAPEESA
nr:SEC14-like protein 4 [Dermacentor andersoni]